MARREVQELAKGEEGKTALLAACELEDARTAQDCARVLLDAHFNVRRAAANGETPLYLSLIHI